MKQNLSLIISTIFTKEHIESVVRHGVTALAAWLTTIGALPTGSAAQFKAGLGAFGVAFILNFINKLEQRLAAAKGGVVAPAPVAAIVRSSILLLTALLALSLTTGCAYLDSDTHQYTGTNGIVHCETHARAYTLFDANSALAKFRNSNGGPTNAYSSGTVLSGLNESSSASNIVSIINAAAMGAAQGLK